MKPSIIIVTDIHGQTLEISNFYKLLTELGFSVSIISPYHQKVQLVPSEPLPSEDSYYQTFLNECGHDEYVKKVNKILLHLSNKAVVISFSAGASAAWRSINELPIDKTNNIKHLIAFYPSQIRNHLHLIPKIPVTIIFPKHEPHFSVDNCINRLMHMDYVVCIKIGLLHGFMNKQSKNYHMTHSNQIFQLLTQTELLENQDDFCQSTSKALMQIINDKI